MDRKLTRTKNGRYCTVQIELKNGHLSVTGEEGRITTKPQARKEALAYWRSFFEEDPKQIFDMNQRCGTRFTSATGAARYVLNTDGEFHGLDVSEAPDGKLRMLESCGCIHETIAAWFPEVAPLIPWHLNDLKAGCEHQDALGWGHGKDVALSKDDLTPAQREALEAQAEREAEREREHAYRTLKAKGGADLVRKLLGRNPSIDAMHAFSAQGVTAFALSSLARQLDAKLREHVKALHPAKPIESAVYKDSLCAPCPECGYRYGTAWLTRTLPAEVIALAETVLKNTNAA